MTDDLTISLQPGTVIDGKYEVVKCLGSGSMGLVYACRDKVLGQVVAVKVLFPEVASDKVASARFINEIRASYEVSHPNVVRAYSAITERDLVAYSMEYVGGGDLASKLGSGERMPILEIVGMLSQMAAGCQAIHDAGIVHRDLKPENILLTQDGNVKIADFGIARNRHASRLTEHGGVVGTIDYVAPEYMLKSQVDNRSDIYALGILAYEMVTGESPFQGDSVYATMTKRLKTDPDPPSQLRSECPTDLDRIILKAMQREPEDRYQRALDMYKDLRALAVKLGAAVQDAGDQNDGRQVALSEAGVDMQPNIASVSGSGRGLAAQERAFEAASAVAMAGMVGISSDSATRLGSKVAPKSDPTAVDILEDESLGAERGGVDSGETTVLSNSLLKFAVETDSQDYLSYVPKEPLVASSRDRVGLVEASRGLRPMKARVETDGFEDSEEPPSYTGEMVALGFAAVVGIGCGFMFLRLFAPSWLEKWPF